jgi:hypothetical protein
MCQEEPISTRIARLAWGRIEVEGCPPFKDAKIFPAEHESGIGAKLGHAMCRAFSPQTFKN